MNTSTKHAIFTLVLCMAVCLAVRLFCDYPCTEEERTVVQQRTCAEMSMYFSNFTKTFYVRTVNDCSIDGILHHIIYSDDYTPESELILLGDHNSRVVLCGDTLLLRFRAFFFHGIIYASDECRTTYSYKCVREYGAPAIFSDYTENSPTLRSDYYWKTVYSFDNKSIDKSLLRVGTHYCLSFAAQSVSSVSRHKLVALITEQSAVYMDWIARVMRGVDIVVVADTRGFIMWDASDTRVAALVSKAQEMPIDENLILTIKFNTILDYMMNTTDANDLYRLYTYLRVMALEQPRLNSTADNFLLNIASGVYEAMTVYDMFNVGEAAFNHTQHADDLMNSVELLPQIL